MISLRYFKLFPLKYYWKLKNLNENKYSNLFIKYKKDVILKIEKFFLFILKVRKDEKKHIFTIQKEIFLYFLVMCKILLKILF